MDEYHSKFVGKSQRKSDKGPTKEKIPLIDSKMCCIQLPLLIFFSFYHIYNHTVLRNYLHTGYDT